MGELCDILHELHCQTPPIVHRDIKPSNIIVTPYDHLMLLDFNAAKYTTDENREDTILLGTKGYAAPEQYGFGSSTPQTDIYALGILMKQLVAALPAPTVKFDAVIAKCTQMDPSNRITDVDSLKQELNNGYHPSLVPPGYRTRTPWKMMLSSLIYLFIFWLSLTMEFENATPIQTWVQRIFCLVMMLVIVFFSFNYRNIQRFMPLCSGHSRIVRLIGILLMDVIAVAALFIVMVVIVSSI
jgi:serine/threonine protein kinase